MTVPKPTPGESGFVQARTLVLVRWVAVVAQAVTVYVVHFEYGYRLPIVEASAAIAASAAVNVFASLGRFAGAGLSERRIFGFLAFDTVQLAVLLHLTGGIQNPFSLLLLAPVTVGASALSRGSFIGLALLAAAAASLLALDHRPLPWDGPLPELPTDLILAMWIATVVAIAFMTVYVGRVAIEGRRMSEALAATRDALAREQRVVDLGALAAAAAHELGSPLSTITVIANELVRELPPDSGFAEDARLLRGQTERCKTILAELSRQPRADEGGDAYLRTTLTSLVESMAEPHLRREIAFDVSGRGLDDSAEPILARRPELVNGLGNFLSNALQFARSRARAEVGWSADEVTVTVYDDGPGFPAALLGRLGEPYLTTRLGQEGHLGLGIFIARTLLERTGASVALRNRSRRGAEVEIRWPRTTLQQQDGNFA